MMILVAVNANDDDTGCCDIYSFIIDDLREMLTKSKKTENTSESDDEYFHDEKGDPTSILRDDSFIYDNNDITKDNQNYDHHHNNCDGCIEAAVIHYLIRNRNWTYFKLAIDGLKSVVFQNPSPTWCIASANIW